MTDGPLALYRARVSSGQLVSDPAQEPVLAHFEALYRSILSLPPMEAPSRGWLARLRNRGPKPAGVPGLYVYGPVGRGKSMMMDLFHSSLPSHMSRRLHFHMLMREAHTTLHEWRVRGDGRGAGDPIPDLARALTRGKRVLCLDEMDIQDIGDAMIVGRLFDAICGLGVVVVTTSNRPPDELYRHGLQREKFLPFIALMKSRMQTVAIDSPVDHRLDNLRGMTVYLDANAPGTDARLDEFMGLLSGGVPAFPTEVHVNGRTVPVPLAAGPVARFTFTDLCRTALGSHDYLALAERFDVIVVSDIPILEPRNRDEARRFVVLVDALYENGTALVCSAAAMPTALYAEGDGAFEFQRTVSRLLEMQTEGYLERARSPRRRTSGADGLPTDAVSRDGEPAEGEDWPRKASA
ncbi:cell division protein ZapE [Phaeovibrio sulfidiphilus]|uniref:cell division protein ZapE n=1 Tax=Phaeovibrio sulfidiphilus TaxID=1220600 RepID=UPI0018D8E307|nr:cell division protein ZapE [Phaeovibrio sulfidiphilus]